MTSNTNTSTRDRDVALDFIDEKLQSLASVFNKFKHAAEPHGLANEMTFGQFIEVVRKSLTSAVGGVRRGAP
jgi:hypothetical protein